MDQHSQTASAVKYGSFHKDLVHLNVLETDDQ